MTEPNEQRYFRVIAPVAVFPQPTHYELTGERPEPLKAGEMQQRVDAGYTHYNSRVPLTATAQQIAHNLECGLIAEVTEEEWQALPADTSRKPFVRTPADEQGHKEQIINGYDY
ncbi:hypothetical protein [Rhodococcoides fascians]|uniref:hypothetical protein n=1 Tax=Rhodococcoides fascians TaxID=1828 RepID=UPI0012D2C752|nr:hypothetical protein [Rhodococcus fascians]